MQSFDEILAIARHRKGGEAGLAALIPSAPDPEKLISQPDCYYLAEMTRSIFQSGFVWRVINQKWPQFCEAFFDFDLNRLMKLTDEDWADYLHDSRIVRHRAKIQALRHNIWFVHETAMQYDGFGRFLHGWPVADLVGLFGYLKAKGSRLGGHTGQYFLQKVGFDSFALTRDVVQALQLSGLKIADNPTSQRDLKAIQAIFNSWHESSGFSYLQLSFILAFSAGDNQVFAEDQKRRK